MFISSGPEFRNRLAGGPGSVSLTRLQSRCQQKLWLSQCYFEPNGYKFYILQTMSSAVVQLYAADRNCMWSKKCSGVACLVKDNPQRSYFLRIFDIKVSFILLPLKLQVIGFSTSIVIYNSIDSFILYVIFIFYLN